MTMAHKDAARIQRVNIKELRSLPDTQQGLTSGRRWLLLSVLLTPRSFPSWHLSNVNVVLMCTTDCLRSFAPPRAKAA